MGACHTQPTQLSSSEYMRWVKNPSNKLYQQKEIGDYRYELQYKPPAYMAYMEQSSQKKLDTLQFQHRKKELENTWQFNLMLAHKEYGNILNQQLGETYFERLSYLVTNIQTDLMLVADQDTLSCVLYHVERNYNLAPYTNILIGFERKNTHKELTLIYNDRLLGAGPLMFKYPANQLIKLPTLDI